MKLIIALIMLLFIFGTIVWILLYRSWFLLLEDVRRGEFKTPLIRQVIVKYNDCKKLDIKVKNVRVFVEKVTENNKICGLSAHFWEKTAKCAEYIIVMLATAAIFVMRRENDAVCVIAAVAALSAMALHLLGRITDTRQINKIIITDMVDFLENSGELPLNYTFFNAKADRLTGKAYADFVKLNRCYQKIQSENSFAIKNQRT